MKMKQFEDLKIDDLLPRWCKSNAIKLRSSLQIHLLKGKFLLITIIFKGYVLI